MNNLALFADNLQNEEDMLIKPIKLLELNEIDVNNPTLILDKNIENITLLLQNLVDQQQTKQQSKQPNKINNILDEKIDNNLNVIDSQIVNNESNTLNNFNNYYLSFDCACATLGYLLTEIVDIDIDNFFLDKNIINPKSIKLKLIKYGVINLVEGFLVKEVPIRNQIFNLRVFLDSLVKDINIESINVLVENQPSINENSNLIESGIYMYFAMAKSIVSVPATYKNTICFNKSLSIQNYYEKYSRTYSANKNHSADNLAYYFKVNNLDINLANKSLYNHLGDAFMQFIYIIKEKIILVNDKYNKKSVRFIEKPIEIKIENNNKQITDLTFLKNNDKKLTQYNTQSTLKKIDKKNQKKRNNKIDTQNVVLTG